MADQIAAAAYPTNAKEVIRRPECGRNVRPSSVIQIV